MKNKQKLVKNEIPTQKIWGIFVKIYMAQDSTNFQLIFEKKIESGNLTPFFIHNFLENE